MIFSWVFFLNINTVENQWINTFINFFEYLIPDLIYLIFNGIATIGFWISYFDIFTIILLYIIFFILAVMIRSRGDFNFLYDVAVSISLAIYGAYYCLCHGDFINIKTIRKRYSFIYFQGYSRFGYYFERLAYVYAVICVCIAWLNKQNPEDSSFWGLDYIPFEDYEILDFFHFAYSGVLFIMLMLLDSFAFFIYSTKGYYLGIAMKSWRGKSFDYKTTDVPVFIYEAIGEEERFWQYLFHEDQYSFNEADIQLYSWFQRHLGRRFKMYPRESFITYDEICTEEDFVIFDVYAEIIKKQPIDFTYINTLFVKKDLKFRTTDIGRTNKNLKLIIDCSRYVSWFGDSTKFLVFYFLIKFCRFIWFLPEITKDFIDELKKINYHYYDNLHKEYIENEKIKNDVYDTKLILTVYFFISRFNEFWEYTRKFTSKKSNFFFCFIIIILNIYYVFFTYDWKLGFIVDSYVILSTLIFFLVFFFYISQRTNTREVTNKLMDLVVSFSVGYVVIGLQHFMESTVICRPNLSILNGFFIFSIEVSFFRYWLIFFFFLFVLLTRVYINQSLSSLTELPVLLMVINFILFVIISLVDLFALIISLEVLSLLILGLCGFSMNNNSTEASIKYFIQNTIITGIVVLGFFLSYFIFKSTNLLFILISIEFIFKFKILSYSLNILLSFSIILWLLSFLFKLGLFPVNFYVPDIYTGSSSPAIFLMSALIKPTVLFVFIFRISYLLKFNDMLIVIICGFCVASIIIGDLMALNSDNIKRFFGYSSISQYGFILLAVFSDSLDVLFFVFLFLFLYNIAIFFILAVLVETRDYDLFDMTTDMYFTDLNLCLKQNYSLKILVTFCFILMSGLPPFILFFFKYGIFVQLFDSENYIYLVLILFSNIISFTYYFRILSDIWFFDLDNVKHINASPARDFLNKDTNFIINNHTIFFSFLFLFIVLYFLYNNFDEIFYYFVAINSTITWEFNYDLDWLDPYWTKNI